MRPTQIYCGVVDKGRLRLTQRDRSDSHIVEWNTIHLDFRKFGSSLTVIFAKFSRNDSGLAFKGKRP